jgi:hypothetical protein
MQERLRKLDNVPSSGSAQQFGELIAREHAANARVVKEANIKAE